MAGKVIAISHDPDDVRDRRTPRVIGAVLKRDMACPGNSQGLREATE